MPPARLIARIACLAILASAIAGCDVLRAARGCENPPLSRAAPTPLLATPTPPAPRALSAAEREVRAREIGASERGHSLEEVVPVGAQPHGYVGLPVEVHAYRLATRDGRDTWIVYVDPSGRRVPEDALGLAWVTEGVRTHGKFEGGDLGGVVARSWPSDVLPVTFQVVAPPWDGPPPPLPPDASPEEWNAFVNRHRNAFYRPIVTPFIEQLRSLGAIVTDPTLAPGTYVVGAFVFANVRADQICALVRRDDVLRAYYAPASIY